jgi:hypothetical protein
MTALALRRALRINRTTAPREDTQLAAFRVRLEATPSLFASLSADQKKAILAYDGPEISGKIRSKRRRAKSQ